MSALARIISAVLGHGGPAVVTAAPSEAVAAGSTPLPPVNIAAALAARAASQPELDWRHSIVDLLKLIGLDSSITARRELARELRYQGDQSNVTAMNKWLHDQVLVKLAEHGGVLPPERS